MSNADQPEPVSATGDPELDQVWASFLNSSALLSDAQVEEAERAQQSQSLTGIPRRCLLASARFSGKEMVERAKDRDTAVVFATVAISGEAWLDRQRALLDLAETQIDRLKLSLVERADMKEVLEEAEASFESN